MSIFTDGAHIVPPPARPMDVGGMGKLRRLRTQIHSATKNRSIRPVMNWEPDEYHQHAEQWGKGIGIEPYAPCMAVYHAQDGHVVMTIRAMTR